CASETAGGVSQPFGGDERAGRDLELGPEVVQVPAKPPAAQDPRATPWSARRRLSPRSANDACASFCRRPAGELTCILAASHCAVTAPTSRRSTSSYAIEHWPRPTRGGAARSRGAPRPGARVPSLDKVRRL